MTRRTVGLYDITTTSRPLDIVPGEPVTDDALSRVRQWMSLTHKAIAAIRAEPGKYEEAARQSAERLWYAVAGVQVCLQDAPADLAPRIAAAIEAGARLAEECEMLRVNASLEKPVMARESSSRAGQDNLMTWMQEEEAKKDREARQAVNMWADRAIRRPERERLEEMEIAVRYLGALQLDRRTADRVRRVFKIPKGRRCKRCTP